ncbi:MULTISPECIES: hypothetical protein [Actinokineospora]|uniref:Uncharacterized protein n=1 Tax=Actinokineospora fastidiosa TaxID=1816 RepID=A0A918GQF0_9PSEU|nr:MULTISPECIES: hypothetical protein [Actinokineospora]UVS78037.1 hypothetical protein Actkin_01761 [Actinokineospora sp. UTMC 2448]GGS50166.1 hypothetical protein GCM10010171_51660 [Actinokineospora fastidiosa]
MPAATPTVADFTDFVRHLMAEGWSRLPTEFAGFLACRVWSDDSADTVVVFDLDHVHARRESADGTVTWLFDGDLGSVRHALAGLAPPIDAGLV